MRKTFALLCVVLFSVISVSHATAKESNTKKKKQPSQVIVLTPEQFMEIVLSRPPQAQVQPSKPGDKGDKGDKGDRGSDGSAGSAGATGERGADGAPGKDGAPGRDGVGFAQGVIFLVNGACPAGTTIQGPQNR